MSRINTNISSIQANHRLQANNHDLNLRLQRLSTGLRINSGADDPAGLIASETLRSEIKGISQSIDNSTRATNVISTAEGALNEISSLLLDVRGLINHAANTGANSDAETKADQLQIDSLLESIDRIANTTQFGGEKLINGNFAYSLSGLASSAIATATVFGAKVPQGATVNVTAEVTGSAQTAKLAYAASSIANNVTIELAGLKGTETFSFVSGQALSSVAAAINSFSDSTGISATVSGTGSTANLLLNSQAYGSDAFVSVKPINGAWGAVPTGSTTKDVGQDTSVLLNGQTASVKGLQATIRSNGLDLVLDLTAARATHLGTSNFYITGGGATFQIGPNVNANGQVSLGIPSVATSNLGNAVVGFLNTINGSGVNSVVGGHTTSAENIVEEAISQVAIIRGRLGGLQKNQIQTNINSQNVALENVQAAESAIRDADVATEVAAMTRAQILVQSTTSVMKIANQQPQSVLSLLQ